MIGEKEAEKISRLYAEYEQIMFVCARSILHDEYLAEDAVHEAFLRIIRNADKISDVTSDNTKSYVRKTLRSAATDIYRKNKRDRENTEPLERQEDFLSCGGEVYDHVLPLVDSLPDKYRSAFRCMAVHGLSAKESASVLRISETCARKRYERAKKLLRGMLTSDFGTKYIAGKETK